MRLVRPARGRVFVHASYDDVVACHAVDFAARHFRPEPSPSRPPGPEALIASAKGLRNLSPRWRAGRGRDGCAAVLLGLDDARRVLRADPHGAEAWKLLGQLEMLREPAGRRAVPRFRLPFDPVFDLSTVRTTYALRQAADAAPDDFVALLLLGPDSSRAARMNEAALPAARPDRHADARQHAPARNQAEAEARRGALRGGSSAASPPDGLGQPEPARPDRRRLLAAGRAEDRGRCSSWRGPRRGAVLGRDRPDRHPPAPPRPARAGEGSGEGAPSPPRPGLNASAGRGHAPRRGRLRDRPPGLPRRDRRRPDLFEAHYGLAVPRTGRRPRGRLRSPPPARPSHSPPPRSPAPPPRRSSRGHALCVVEARKGERGE